MSAFLNYGFENWPEIPKNKKRIVRKERALHFYIDAFQDLITFLKVHEILSPRREPTLTTSAEPGVLKFTSYSRRSPGFKFQLTGTNSSISPPLLKLWNLWIGIRMERPFLKEDMTHPFVRLLFDCFYLF